MRRSNHELREMLRELNNLPSKDVKKKLDGIRMKFSEWQSFANEDLGFFSYHQIKGYNQKFEDKVDISYEEYLKMQQLPITREQPRNSNIARKARETLERFKTKVEAGEYSEKELSYFSKKMWTEEEVSILEEIEMLWEDVRAKYDPVQEAIRAVEEAKAFFLYASEIDSLTSSIPEVKSCIDQFKKSTKYLYEYRESTEESLAFEDEMLKAMEGGLRLLEELQSSSELPLEEFINKFGLNKEEIISYYKARIKETPAPFVKAREGKGFKLNDEGEIEIVDEAEAKNLISGDFFSENVLLGFIETLNNAERYERITQYLPEKAQDSFETKKIELDGAAAYVTTEEQNEASEESISELMRKITDNDKKIAANDEKIREALKEKILRQQQIIQAQEREIADLREERNADEIKGEVSDE